MATSSKLIIIVNKCFKCEGSVSSPQRLREHLNIHGITIPSRSLGFRRKNNEQYTFVKCGNHHGLIEAHAGYPACSAHYADNNDQSQEPSSSRQPQESSQGQEQSSSQLNLNDVRCVTSLTKQRSSTRAEDCHLEMELLNPQDLSFPPVDDNDHFVAEQFNVTNAMYEFQCSILRQKWKLSLEDHIHHAMAINSILLVSPNKYPDNLSPHF
ncbi:hypothetical protein G6F42_015048 [Rhizopus arrhizus]|nr:hypothetical protein G6F42_015048 [Rhizopus arrhizus]